MQVIKLLLVQIPPYLVYPKRKQLPGELGKLTLSLCLTAEAPRDEYIEGSESIVPPFLVSTLDGDDWSAQRFCRFTPVEGATGTH